MGCTESRFDVTGLQYSVPVTEPLPGESSVYRNPNARLELTHTIRGEPTLLTLHDAYIRSFTKFADKEFLGTRPALPDGKFGPYKFKTYSQIQDISTKLGSGMLNLKLNTTPNPDAEFIIMWSKNREEWVLTDIACILYKMCLVPVYDTLGPETINYIFSQTKATTLFLSNEHIEAAIQNAPKMESLRTLVAFEAVTPELRQKAEAANLKLFTLEEVINSGAQVKQEYRKPQPDDLYTVNYTSGTTGLPKGVIITHRNQLSASAAVCNREDIDVKSSDRYLSYLPLAHTMERTAILLFVLYGCKIGFYNGDVQRLKEDMQELKPTFFVSVPRLFNRFYEKMQEGLSKLTGAKKNLAESAVKTKLDNLKQFGTLHHKMYDALVFKKMKAAMGGCVRIMLTGSAPIEPEVQNFLRIAIGVPFVEGFGQTETCAASFISRTETPSFGHIGGPLGCIEFKLVDVPDMNYTSQDRDSYGLPTPRGEICMRGPAGFKGYYKDPDRTAETIDKEGWIHTGDVGRVNPDGSLSIIDRKKNIFKLAQGEYVASEKVENTYLTCKYVAEAFLYGDSLKTHTIAIIVPNKENLIELGKEMGLQNLSYEQLCENKEVRARVLAEMTKKGKESKINSFELAKQVHLEPVSFGEKGLLTPTFKLVRHTAKQHYQTVINELYSLPVASAPQK